MPLKDDASASEIAVIGYLVAKQYNLEWQIDFHRACSDLEYARQSLSEKLRVISSRIHLPHDIHRIWSAVGKHVGWLDLLAMLTFSNRKRKGRNHKLLTEPQIEEFLGTEFGEKLGTDAKTHAQAETQLDSGAKGVWIHLLDGGRLPAAAAGEIIDGWRAARAVGPKKASDAVVRFDKRKRKKKRSR